MEGKKTFLSYLKELEIFNRLEDQDLEGISELFSIVKFSMGEPIFFEDKKPKYFFLVAKGEVRQLIQSPHENKNITLAIYQKGYLIIFV